MFWTGILTWFIAACAGVLFGVCASFEWWLTKMQFGRAFLQWRLEQLRAQSDPQRAGEEERHAEDRLASIRRGARRTETRFRP